MGMSGKIKTVTLDGKEYPLGYRVCTEDMKSLGLRNNTNIHTYPVGEWYYLPEEDVVPGNEDWAGWGGFWVARSLGGARTLTRDMKERYGQHVRTFKCAIDRVLYSNSYRIKTNAVYLFEEVHHEDTLEHLPDDLPNEMLIKADEVFFSRLNKPFSTDKDTDEFYFTVPEPILEDLSKDDEKLLLTVLQYDQISPRMIGWYGENDIPREEWGFTGYDLLVKGTELADTIDDEYARAFAQARIWHHAAGSCYFMSPEHQQIAVDGIEKLVSEFGDADDDTKAILEVWDRFIHNRMEDFLSRDEEMRPLREKHETLSRD